MKRRKDGLRKGKTQRKEKGKEIKAKSKETCILKTKIPRERFIILYFSTSLCKLAWSLYFVSVLFLRMAQKQNTMLPRIKVNSAILHEKRKVK